MKWTKEEMQLIVSICSKEYEMDITDRDYEGPFDFEGDILVKDSKGGYKVMSWDYDEVYYKGTLENCCKHCIGEKV